MLYMAGTKESVMSSSTRTTDALTVVSRSHSTSSSSAEAEFDEEANMQTSTTDIGPSISLTDNNFISSVTRSDMYMKRNLFVGMFVTCILLTMIMIKVYNYKGMTLLAATNHEPYVEALGLFHQTNKFSNLRNSVDDASWSPTEFRSLHQHIMEGVHDKLAALQVNLTSELAIIKEKLKSLQSKLEHVETEAKFEAEAIERGVVVRNLPAMLNEHLYEKLHELFSQGLRVADVRVEQAHRRTSGNEDHGVVVIMRTVEDRVEVLNSRKNLPQSPSFHNIHIEPYMSHDFHLSMENMRTLIQILGKDDDVFFRNGKLIPKP